MKLSIVLATVDRAAIIGGALDSVAGIKLEADDAVEVIVVDQSRDTATFDVVEGYRDRLSIKYLHAVKRGLSHSRNLGLELVEGDVFCFGDDDGRYSEGLLRELKTHLDQSRDSFICAGVYLPGSTALSPYSERSTPIRLTRRNLFLHVTSISIFLKNKAGLLDYRFNERLGLGAEFGSCEEKEYLYRIITAGHRGVYQPAIRVYHAAPGDRSAQTRYSYARGHGAFAHQLLTRGDACSWRLGLTKAGRSLRHFPDVIRWMSLDPWFSFLGFWSGFSGMRGKAKW